MTARHVYFSAMVVAVAFAGPPPSSAVVPAESETVWECPQSDGVPVYTNRERPGCRAMQLKPLSIVPSLPDLPQPQQQMVGPAPPRYDGPPPSAWGPPAAPAVPERNVPDWGKDWYARIAPSGSTREEVCALYSEWIRLNERTRGGVYFGNDPSYGSDPSQRNQRGPSYSFYDNARWLTLAKLFGTGFIPVGCS